MLSLSDGRVLVKLARKSVEKFFKDGRVEVEVVNRFSQSRGVFVTIHTYPKRELRGCIGFPFPEYPVYEAVQRAAVEAAFKDPRFPPLKRDELKWIIFEVSILTEPELIEVRDPKDYLKNIEVKRHGVIIECGFNRALFLPQVWEVIPKKEEFLANLCLKAGLTPDCWLDERTRMYRFEVQAFEEVEPEGNVREVKL